MAYFGKAKLGKELYANAQDYEETEIAKAANSIDSYVGNTRELPNNISMDLLWENTDPTSNFTATTITATDIQNSTGKILSQYQYVLIVTKGVTTGDSLPRSNILLQVTENESSNMATVGASSGYTCRNCWISYNGIRFGAGRAGANENNQYAIPLYILGIKTDLNIGEYINP